MKQVLIKRGQAIIEEVPPPKVDAGYVLVETGYSCISIGTEMSGVKEGSKSLLRRALENPDQVALAARMVLDQGIGRTLSAVRGALESGYPTGYSAAGTVREVGEGITDVQVGDRVACAGSGIANHAEIISVPRNLMVRIPDRLPLPEASTVTLGAIALQGIRRASPTIGETFLVMGLDILGQLTVQMLKANGCKVAGLDPDASRLAIAESRGMDYGIAPDEDVIARIHHVTDGFGADGVIITAATPSDDVVSQAFQSCRKKGRVVLVGDVGLNLKRSDFYAKEIDFLISTSYGPGRYEPNYETRGLDYPIGYVRWTENRDMQEYVRLLADGRIDVTSLIGKEYGIEDAPSAYAELSSGADKPLMVLLRYGAEGSPSKWATQVSVNPAWKRKEGRIEVAVIGGGGFAKAMHLPNLRKLASVYGISAVMSRTGTNAKAVARQFEARYATTNYADVLNDRDVDAVLISTRHDLHAPMAIDAVKAGKHVCVEKPMALNRAELSDLISALISQELPAGTLNIASCLRARTYTLPVSFMVGFNRRFSPFMQRIRTIVSSRTNPMMINYRMNAGYLPLTHWVHGNEGGGRNIGEACHIYDLFTFLTDAEVLSVKADAIVPATAQFTRNDNFVATITCRDGSVCNLIYTALGAKDYPKEMMEIYVDGKIIQMSDYRKLEIFGSKGKGFSTQTMEKGHLQEMEAFARAIQEGKEAIPLWQQVQATEISFEVERQICGTK